MGYLQTFLCKRQLVQSNSICFPFGRVAQQPSDQLKTQLGRAIMENNPFREQLKQHVFYNTDPDDVFWAYGKCVSSSIKD